MRLIFNKDNSESIKEFQTYFPNISGTIPFSRIRPDIIAAQEEVEKFIGTDCLNEAIDLYLEESSGSGSGSGTGAAYADELVMFVQRAVALFAYQTFAQNNDLTHSATGRVARLDTDSEEVNTRLIEKDNLALSRKAYSAMDKLIRFIDTNKLDSWTKSTQFARTKDLLLWNADLFDSYYSIDNSRYLFIKLIPIIRDVQLQIIRPRLGTDLYAQLIAKVKANTELTTSEKTIFDLCAIALSKQVIANAYRQLPYQLFPESIFQQLWTAGNGAAGISSRKVMIQDVEELARQSLVSLEAEIALLETSGSGSGSGSGTGDTTDDTEITGDIADRMDDTNFYARV